MTLKELRLQSKKTAAEVAAALGVTANAISNYEQGVRSINIEQVLKLSILFDITAEEVIQAQIASIAVRSSQ